jgi:uncharacterized membrane protein
LEEVFAFIAGLTCLAFIPVAILAIAAFIRTQRISALEQRITRMQAELDRRAIAPAAAAGVEPVVEAAIVAEPVADGSAGSPFAPQPAAAAPAGTRGGTPLESVIGKHVLGWVAAVLLLFGTAFFLKYAYDNGWIGPLGQVALGLMFGLALIVAGWRYDRSGWRVFSQMLTGAGTVVLYLATYSAFGFYRLLPQQAAGAFLLVIVVESVLLAVLYEASILGLVAVIGGLITPLLMQSVHDEYQALFIYLALLNLGVLVLLTFRNWVATGTVAFLGTQGLYWLWHNQNYHPEKLPWAIGFQAVLFALFVGQAVVVHVLHGRKASIEDLARLVLIAGYWFAAGFILLRPEYRLWMGTFAVAMAAIYTALAWLVHARSPNNTRLLVTLLAIGVAHIAIALPIEADARFVSLGWAALAAALWWFGLRIKAWPLRAMAGIIGTLAVMRVVLWDSPYLVREPFLPIANGYALPSLLVAGLVIFSVLAGRRMASRFAAGENTLVEIAAVVGVMLVWWVLSVDTYSWFVSRGALPDADIMRWRWAGQLALSALWAVYASGLLALGFRLKRPHLRWIALALYAVTVCKVFFIDAKELGEFYRILAFFILAILLGAAAWAYQRLQPAVRPGGEAT